MTPEEIARRYRQERDAALKRAEEAEREVENLRVKLREVIGEQIDQDLAGGLLKDNERLEEQAERLRVAVEKVEREMRRQFTLGPKSTLLIPWADTLAQALAAQPCGHPASMVQSGDEGTKYCRGCEEEGGA